MNARHITASVFINDDGYGLHQDREKWLEELARHAQTSHCRSGDRLHNRTGEAWLEGIEGTMPMRT